ncbi:MAG: L,D-transpeptidase family protein [Methyloceanibacter sp.]|nr:L,D-transpeptidase family protein [Methyloceanibacter sp.]
MIFDKLFRKRPRFRSVLSAMALAGAFGAFLMASQAGAQNQFNPFGAFTDSGPITKEERARREQARTNLYDRLSPDYRMNVPFVSEAAIMSLQQAIQRYQQIVAAGGWPPIPDRVTLRQGDTSAEITAIRQRLVLEGDLPPSSGRNPKFDQEFLEGLARFQIRHGLRVTGFVDSRTLRALNVSAVERLRQLQTNLSRAQKLMSISKAPRYVLVNVPAYTAQAIEHNQVALDSPVVVGKPQRATPAVAAKIVEVNFYPTWSVPDIVARNDLIPTIRKDPNYFYEQRFNVMRDWGASPLDPAEVDWASPQVVSYKFRQDPGPQNALGLVRINMPNKHAVYMHDTPLKALFSQSARAFSSGCVRVERVFDLVAWLLGDQGWTLAKVEDQIASGKKIDVKLKKHVPVHFVYLSAFAAGNGMAQFRPDIYGQDAGYGMDMDEQDAVVLRESRAITP